MALQTISELVGKYTIVLFGLHLDVLGRVATHHHPAYDIHGQAEDEVAGETVAEQGYIPELMR